MTNTAQKLLAGLIGKRILRVESGIDAEKVERVPGVRGDYRYVVFHFSDGTSLGFDYGLENLTFQGAAG